MKGEIESKLERSETKLTGAVGQIGSNYTTLISTQKGLEECFVILGKTRAKVLELSEEKMDIT